MNRGQLPTKYDINWGALDHASRAPQLMSCNHYEHTLHNNQPHQAAMVEQYQ